MDFSSELIGGYIWIDRYRNSIVRKELKKKNKKKKKNNFLGQFSQIRDATCLYKRNRKTQFCS